MKLAPTSKEEFTQRFLKGEFGNLARSWDNTAAAAQSGFVGPINFRSRTPGGKFVFGVPFERWSQGYPEGMSEASHYVNESMPDEGLVIQGEVEQLPEGLYLCYSTVPGLSMREAMKSPQHAWGLKALSILRTSLDASDFDDLMEMLREYDTDRLDYGAVIEFSAYSRPVGVLSRKMVVWEVRNY